MRELPHEHQTQAERRVESERAAAAKAREEHRDAVEGLAATYARITADPEAAVAILDYVGRREPRLDAETLREMRRALEIAAAREGDYLAVPDAVRSRCVLMCFELDARGDSRLLDIILLIARRGGAPPGERFMTIRSWRAAIGARLSRSTIPKWISSAGRDGAGSGMEKNGA